MKSLTIFSFETKYAFSFFLVAPDGLYYTNTNFKNMQSVFNGLLSVMNSHGSVSPWTSVRG